MDILFTVIAYSKIKKQFYPIGYAVQDGSWLKVVNAEGLSYGSFSCFEELKEFFIH